MWFGVMEMAYSLLISSILSQIINSSPNRKLLNYGYMEQLKDVMPGILLALVMGISVYLITWIGLPDMLTLCIQVIMGGIIYLGFSKLLRLESYIFLMGILQSYIRKKKEV